MCHSSERWTFRSRRQQHETPEAMKPNEGTARRADAVGQGVEPAVDPQKGEQAQRERELERVS